MEKLTILVMLGVVAVLATAARADDAIYKEGGLIKVRPYPVDEKFRNRPWPAEMEAGFWKRANHAIEAWRGKGDGGITGEHEKWTYPKCMFDFIAGNRDKPLAILQAPDGEHPETAGVDLYWCFTLKGQARKYFWFGKHGGYVGREHLEKMRKAAEIWTRDDPRPTMELVLALEGPDPAVREHALALLRKMRARDPDEVAARSTNEELKSAIEAFKKTDLAKEADYGEDAARWRAWWKFFADHDWKVFEEYERIINPNPHPKYGVGTGPVGATWDPGTRGGWVDARNTDNLRSMRETTVYLMAEEIGNEKIRRLYKEKLRRFVVGLYHVGMGEWDSENYHAHTIAPWLNLYDFARDPEVRLLGKAALDWLTAAGALKYYRGGFGGPTKRDYGGGNKVFGAGVTHMLYLWFGDCPLEDPSPHEDDVHAVTSAYRPPLAAVALARKDFPKPAETWDTKPTYSHWLPGASDRPRYWETLFFGNTYYLGTLASEGGDGDTGPFKMLAYNSRRGVDYFVAYSGSKFNTKPAGDQTGQYRNLVIFLRPDAKNFSFMVPRTAAVEADAGAWFVRLEKTWIAIRPINLGDYKLGGVPGGKYPEDQVMTAGAAGGGFTGFALEIGEEPQGYDAFKQAVKAKGRLDLSKLAEGTVALTGTDGRVLAMTYNRESDLPVLVRDGKRREWLKEFDLYKPVGGDGPMSLGWKEGTLTIRAGGHEFTQTVTKDGAVTFSEK